MIPQISVLRVLGVCGKPASAPPLLDPHVPTPAQQKGLVQLTFTKTQATRGDGEGREAWPARSMGLESDRTRRQQAADGGEQTEAGSTPTFITHVKKMS